ncbi:Spy/CpxP family protein refolding chaperone [Rugamonas sp.]|uniref:Spy/CpxP family protein refolding chaperone n=1 Tax=Rugamonas sp. TaxID=1926287 RepID=UPI0025DD3992|nr:Spy/CpxP family protein refolding chaperone [Rugamonas sp.]
MNIFNRGTLSAFVLGAALAAGVGAFAAGEVAMPGHGQHGDMTAHIDHALKHLYVDLDATDAQKTQIDPLVHQALQDLKPLHQQLLAGHRQAIALLTQPTLDRAAMESARAQNMALADQASKRIVQLLADVGDVLTPAQRQKLADHFSKMHGMRAMHG